MREILFRGKRISDKKWIEGGIVVLDPDSDYVFISEPYYHASTLPVRELIYDRTHLVDKETVCQYTGLTDKNGKKIFEGDIVAYEDEAPGQFEYHDDIVINRGVIEYCEGAFYWTNAVSETFECSICEGKSDCEVIGNIFDNPNLITSEKGAGA